MALIGEMQYLTIGENTYSIPTSGGSTVSITRSLTSGTKSATISVDGTSYDLYAPTPNAGTVTSVRVQATSPVQSSTSTAQSSTLNTTISLADGYGDTKNPYGTKTKNYVLAGPTSGSAAAPSFRQLVAADIPDLSDTYLTSSDITDKADKFVVHIGDQISGDYYQIDKTYQQIGLAAFSGSQLVAIDMDIAYPYLGVATMGGALVIGFGFSATYNGTAILNGYVILENDTAMRINSNTTIPTKVSQLTNDRGFITSYTETDPTVPSWAKASTKPTYTASEVGAVATSAVGAASGVVPLNASSKIDSTYLPSYVDDVIEGYYYNNKFYTTSAHTTQITGETGKIFVDLSTNKTYRYGGSAFTEVSQGSIVSISRSLTSGTKSATITVDGTGYDLYAPTPPTVPTNVSAFTNDAGYITSADVPEGASAYTGTISAIGTAASNGTNNGFARGDHVHNITKTTVDSVLGTGSGTAKFYREDGTWATPNYIANTDEKLQVAAVTSGTTYYPIVGTGTTAATRQFDTTGFIYVGTNGTTSIVGSARLTLGNSTASGSANNKQGVLRLYSTSTGYGDLVQNAVSSSVSVTHTFPAKSGTVAHTSDIPDVSEFITDPGVTKISTTAGAHSAITNATGAVSFNVPTKTSHLTNDSNFVTSSGVTSVTLTQGDGISIGSSGTAITTTGTRTIALSTSGVTANSYGPSDNVSPSHGGTFSVPYVTVDKYGRITAASTKTITLPADSNTDTKVTQGNSTSTQWRKVLLNYNANDDAEAAVTSVTGQVYASPYVSVKASDGSLHLGGTLTSSKINSLITGGTQTAAVTTSPYKPALWKFDAGIAPTNGDVVFIQTPGGGHSYGEYLSLDNGTTYKPITHSGTSKMTTHYGSGSAIMLVYDSDWSTSSMYPLAGGTSTTTITGGAWRIINGYLDGNTYTSAYCSTAAETAAKSASMNGYAATANRYVMVTMTTANSAASAITLNINGTGAKPIYINGSASSSSNHTLPAGSYLVFYDGTNYHFRTDGYMTVKYATQAPSSETTFMPVLARSGVDIVNRIHEYTRLWIKAGSTSANGYVYLGLGNNTATGVNTNSFGCLRLYGVDTGYSNLRYANAANNVENWLPSTSGTLLNTGTTSFTQTITSGQKIGTLRLDNINHVLYAPSVLYCDIWPDDVSGSVTVSAQNTNYAINLSSITQQNGGFTISSNGIKIPVSGYYLVSMSTAFNTLAANSNLMGCGLMDTSSNVVLGPMYNRMNGTYDRVVIEPHVIQLTKDTIIKPFVRNNSAAGGVCHAVYLSLVLLNPA